MSFVMGTLCRREEEQFHPQQPPSSPGDYTGAETAQPGTYYHRLSGITPLKNPQLLSVTHNTGVGKSHNSPPSRNYNNSKVAEASIKGNFNKAKSLSSRNKELQQTIMKDKAG